jgi:hypothetical protein
MPHLTESTAARHPGFQAMSDGSSLRSRSRLSHAHPAARLRFWVLSERDNNYGVYGWVEWNPPRGGTPPVVKRLSLSHVRQSHVSRQARPSDPSKSIHLILFRGIGIAHRAQWLIIGCSMKCKLPHGYGFRDGPGNLYRLWRHAQYL